MTPIAILCNGPRIWASSRLRGFWLEEIRAQWAAQRAKALGEEQA